MPIVAKRKSSWPLRSGAARRLLRHYRADSEREVPFFSRVFAEYHEKVLIEPARTRGFGLDDGRELSDLEILAKLQHFGAATGLLDFTYSPLIALWFACRKEECDGKVFSINTTDPLAFGKVTHQVMQKETSEVLTPDADAGTSLPWIWEPIATGDAETRVLVQSSLFVIGRPSIAEEASREIVIRKEDKVQLRKELDTIHAIREETLFKDVYGFAQVNRASYSVPPFEGPELYLLFGNRRAQQGDYQGAIGNYDQAIQLQPDSAVAYRSRGVAKGELGHHHDAVVDFNEALRLRPRDAIAYVNRGLAKSKLGRHEEAIADYDRAIRYRQNYADAYSKRGIAKIQLGQHEAAVADFEEVLRLQPDFAGTHNNLGLAKSELGRSEEAIADFDQAIRLQSDHAIAYSNRGATKSDMSLYEDALDDFDEAIRLRPDFAEAYGNRGEARSALGDVEGAQHDFGTALDLATKAGNDELTAEIKQHIQELDNAGQ